MMVIHGMLLNLMVNGIKLIAHGMIQMIIGITLIKDIYILD